MKLLTLTIVGLLMGNTFAGLNMQASKDTKKTQEEEIRQSLLKLNNVNSNDLKNIGEKNIDIASTAINDSNLNLKK